MDIFVKNFPLKTTEYDLEELFSTFGSVHSLKIIKDKHTNESRGFAFINIDFSSNAEATIDKLNGKSYNGKILIVKKSEPKPAERTTYNNKRR